MPKSKKIKIVEIIHDKTKLNIETNDKPKVGTKQLIEYQILDSKDRRASISRAELIERLENYTKKLNKGDKYLVNVFYENIGWRTVSGGGIIHAGEKDISQYIYGNGNGDSGNIEDMGDVMAFSIQKMSDNISTSL
jgi:hypothetical protein